jgi:hypothetical protein
VGSEFAHLVSSYSYIDIADYEKDRLSNCLASNLSMEW